MSPDQALATILQHATCIGDTEALDLLACNGRGLTRPLMAQLDAPRFNASVMGGYALRCSDLHADGPTTLPVTQRITAGTPATLLPTSSAARIFTGAPLPDGADTVVAQESCTPHGDAATIHCQATPGQNIRRHGSHIKRGDQLIDAGTRLNPAHLGLAAIQSQQQLTVYRRLSIALLSSGDELVMPGQALAAGQIYKRRPALHPRTPNLPARRHPRIFPLFRAVQLTFAGIGHARESLSLYNHPHYQPSRGAA